MEISIIIMDTYWMMCSYVYVFREKEHDQLLSRSCDSVLSTLDSQSLCLSLTVDRSWFFLCPSWLEYIYYHHYICIALEPRPSLFTWSVIARAHAECNCVRANSMNCICSCNNAMYKRGRPGFRGQYLHTRSHRRIFILCMYAPLHRAKNSDRVKCTGKPRVVCGYITNFTTLLYP